MVILLVYIFTNKVWEAFSRTRKRNVKSWSFSQNFVLAFQPAFSVRLPTDQLHTASQLIWAFLLVWTALQRTGVFNLISNFWPKWQPYTSVLQFLSSRTVKMLLGSAASSPGSFHCDYSSLWDVFPLPFPCFRQLKTPGLTNVLAVYQGTSCNGFPSWLWGSDFLCLCLSTRLWEG